MAEAPSYFRLRFKFAYFYQIRCVSECVGQDWFRLASLAPVTVPVPVPVHVEIVKIRQGICHIAINTYGYAVLI